MSFKDFKSLYFVFVATLCFDFRAVCPIKQQWSVSRSTMKDNCLLWISPACNVLLCTSSRTDYKFHIRGIDLRQEFFKHLKQQSLYQKQNKILCFCCLFSYRLNVSKQSQQVAVSKRGDPWRHGLLVY